MYQLGKNTGDEVSKDVLLVVPLQHMADSPVDPCQ